MIISRSLFKKYLYSRNWSSLPELETSMSYIDFSKFAPEKKPDLQRLPKPELETTQKLKLDQIHFWTKENFAKKDAFWPNFGLSNP